MVLSFGADLRERRLEAGLSLDGLAKRVHYSRSHLSKIENGVKIPTPELAQLCDNALAAGGTLLAHLDGRPSRRRSSHAANQSVEPDDVLIIGPAGMLRMASSADLPPSLGTTIASASEPMFSDVSIITSFRAQFQHLRTLGQSVRPVDMIPLLMTSVGVLTTMAGRAERTLQPDLYRLAARFAEHAGWMAQENGDRAQTINLTDWATELAQQGGEDMTAYRFIRFGDLSMYDGDAARTIEYANLALQTAKNLRVRGIAAQRLAHGHALALDHDACFRALDLSADLLARANDQPASEPVMGSSTVVDHGAMASGWCLFELGRPREAATLLSTEVARLPADAHRARARYGTRLARCYAAMGELDQACATVKPVLRLLPALDSATIRTDVSGLEASLRRYPKHPAVKRLLPHVAEARPRGHHPRP